MCRLFFTQNLQKKMNNMGDKKSMKNLEEEWFRES